MTLDGILDFLAHGLLHASAWEIVIFVLIATHITILGTTIYLHRCQAHRALDLHPIVSHFFRFWLWLATGMNTKAWAAIHRKHHAKCETELDPHSPQTRGLKKVLWEGAELYRAEAKNDDTLTRFGHGTPNDWLENKLYTPHSTWGIISMMVIDVLLFGAIGLTIWAIQMAWIPFWAAGVVNGIGHYWGYRNYECEDASTNLFPIGIIIGGEEMHNNHHTYATSARFSNKWYEFDIGWMWIRLFEMVGLAKVKKVAPVPKFNYKKDVVDLDTLQAIITNRYDVMARYASSVKQTWHDEFESLKAKIHNANELRAAKKLLEKEPEKLAEEQKAELSAVFANSKALKTMHDMREELASIWGRSNSTREQLLTQLQDWCVRAEASGIKALKEFSHRLRTYAETK